METREKRKCVKWTPDMLAYLREHYADMSVGEIAKHLNISVKSVRNKATYLGLIRREAARRLHWTEKQVEYLSKHYPTGNRDEIAKYLGCSPQAVRRKANSLGLRKVSKDAKKNASRKGNQITLGNPARIGKNQSEVTIATWTLVCSCTIDDYTPYQIATMTERSVEQVEEVLKLCRENGYLNQIKETRVESLTMHHDRYAGRNCSGFRNAGAE